MDNSLHVAVEAVRVQAVAEAGDDDVAGRDDHGELAASARCPVGVLRNGWKAVAGVEPELAAIVLFRVGGRWGTHEIDPALGQNSLTVPDSVLEMQLPEARPVASGAVVEAGH